MILILPPDMKSMTCIVTLLMMISMVYPQNYTQGEDASEPEFRWPLGKQMALSLTFDDARFSQPDKGIPLLDQYGVKGTFYVSPGAMLEKVEQWKQAVESGHDIGNHTLVHPCSGNFPWARDKALEDYTLEQMAQELDSASTLIHAALGIRPSAFAYTCGQTFVGRGADHRSYVPLVAERFETGRNWMNEGPNDPGYCDLALLNGTELDGKSFQEALQLIEQAREQGAWLIFAGHEMDEEGRQTSLLPTIDSICRYASDPANGIWIAPVTRIGDYVREKRAVKEK
jgi:peptidoglycan/xylan/chitin deacetylase (PgdA/CDA1 family)